MDPLAPDSRVGLPAPRLDLEDEEDGHGPDLTVLILYAIGRSRVWVATCLVLGLVGGILFAFSLPNTFTSVGRLRLTAGKREAMTAETSAGLEETTLTPAMADEQILLTSESVFRDAARAIGPLRILRPEDPRRDDDETTPASRRLIHEVQAAVLAMRTGHLDDPDIDPEGLQVAASKLLMANSKVIPYPKSNVITVSVTATSPESARDFTTALMDTHINEHRRAYAVGGFLEANRAKRDAVEAEFRETELAYSEHVDHCGFVHLGSQMETLIEQVTLQERALEGMRAEYEGKKARHLALMASLESMPRRVEQTRRAVMGSNIMVELLRTQLRDIQLEKLKTLNAPGLSRDSRDSYEQSYQRQISEIEKEISALPQIVEVVPEITEDVANPEYENLHRSAIELEAEVGGLLRRVEQLEVSLGFQQERLRAARTCEPIHDRLEREKGEKEAQMTALAVSSAELELMDLLEQQGDSNLRLYQPAILPRQKDGPKRSKLVLMGIAAGAGIGIAGAVLRQLLDSRVRYGRTLERDLGLPLLATIPEIRGLPSNLRRPGAAATTIMKRRA